MQRNKLAITVAIEKATMEKSAVSPAGILVSMIQMINVCMAMECLLMKEDELGKDFSSEEYHMERIDLFSTVKL